MRVLRGFGLIFPALLAAQTNEIVLHHFGYASEGVYPSAQILDSAGNLYGTATGGGSASWGLIFRLDPHGTEGYFRSPGYLGWSHAIQISYRIGDQTEGDCYHRPRR